MWLQKTIEILPYSDLYIYIQTFSGSIWLFFNKLINLIISDWLLQDCLKMKTTKKLRSK